MPGYAETLLGGFRDVAGLAQQNRRLQDSEQQNDFSRRLQAAEFQRGNEAMSIADRNRQAEQAFKDRALMERSALAERLAKERIGAQIETARMRGQQRNIQTVDIVDPTDPSKVIKIDPNAFNEEAYKGGNRAGVIGVTGKTPDAAKKDQAKESGKTRLSSTVDDLSTAYDELEKMGAVIDPNKSSVKNAYERVAASGPGQLVAGAFGTPAQTQRDIINQRRAGLMANMKEATGMSAQSLNSNAELMFYIQMATDPTKSIQANRAALHYLDKTFGLGLGVNADKDTVDEIGKVAPKNRSSGQIGGNQRSVVVGGKTYNFPTPAAAAAFKKEAGIE